MSQPLGTPTSTKAYFTNLAQATLAQTIMYSTPATSAWLAPASIAMVKAVQGALNQFGLRVVVDGKMGPETNAAMTKVFGPDWTTRYKWIEILKQLHDAVLAGGGYDPAKFVTAPPSFFSRKVFGIPMYWLVAGGVILYAVRK